MNYIDDFQAAAVGAGLPAGWTSRFNAGSWSIVSDAGDKMVQKAAQTPAAFWFVSRDSVDVDDGRNNVDIIVRLRVSTISTSSLAGVAIRSTGTDNASITNYSCRLYGPDKLRIYKTINGTLTLLSNVSSGISFVGNTLYYMRFRVNGSSLQAKVWAGALVDQPESWLIDITDTSITGPGSAGFFGVGASTAMAFSEIAIATNGDVPSFVADTTPPVLSSPTGTVASSTTASGTVTTDEGNGVLYFYASTNATESAATVKASGNTQPISSAGLKNVVFVGLTPATTYFAHYVHTDAANNDSARVSSGTSFTTPAPDVTAPTLSAPTALETGATSAVLGVTTDENNGELYVVITTSASPPTDDQIRAGQNNFGAPAVYASSQAISSVGAKSFSATGLIASTTYYTYFHHRDASNNDSSVAAAASFTTTESGTKGIELALFTGATAYANGTGITALWWDGTTPHTFGAPILATNVATTDETGLLRINLAGVTALNIGEEGWLWLHKAAVDPQDSLSFAGRLTVSDIS